MEPLGIERENMKYAIMSDVHANPFMLRMALLDARAAGAVRYVCLGDVSGYNDDAREAIRKCMPQRLPI